MGKKTGRNLLMTKALRCCLRMATGALLFIAAWTAPYNLRVYAQDQEIQDLIFEIRMGSAIITQAAVVLESEGRYYLPLLDIAENYEFVITDSDLSRGYVQGWYISEDNTFSVDRQKNEAYHNGERIALSDINFVDDPFGENTDLFLQLEIFSKIWPEITFSVDLASLQIRAESEATFPFMERKERRQRQEFLSARRATQVGPVKELPYFRNPYGLISLPVLDIDTTVNWIDNGDKATGQVSMNGAQDLAYLTAEYGLTVLRDLEGFRRPEALRLTFSRETTPDQTLPAGVEHFEFGDTRVNYREEISNGTGGRGFYFTTNKNAANREFDVITVEGTGPPGWETELYRNNELIDFGVVDAVGEYRFEDVSTQYGNNRIRVVLYGPQGQIREDVKDYNFASTMLRPGQHSITGGFIDANRDFVPLVDDDPTVEGVAKSLAGSYGLTRNLTMFSTYSDLPTVDGDKSYMTTGATFSAAGGYGQVEAYKSIGKGHALDLRFLTELLGIRLNMVSTFFNNFESPAAGFDDNAKKNEQEIVAARTFRLPFGSLGLQFDANRTRRQNDATETSLRARQTISYSGMQFSNQVDTRLLDGTHQTTSGTLTANVRMRQWYLRGGLAYNYFPQARFTNGNVELRYQTKDDFIAALYFQNDFVSDLMGGGIQFGYDFKKFLGSIDTNWQEERGWEMTLRASTSFGPYAPDGGYNMVSEAQRNLAPVRGHAFLDRNNNELFDEGDEPLPHARLNVNGRISGDETGDDGYVIARQSASGGLANVTLDPSSLEDPYYAPSQEGYSLALRPGTMPDMEFPVIETGAIDGTIFSADDGDPVQGINIQLVNEKDEVVAVTKAAYDGFYTFEFVRPGIYTVRVDPAYQINVPPETVTVVSDDLFASGIDLQLQEQVKETDGAFSTAEADAAADQASFDEEFEDALDAQSVDGLTDVEPQSGAESGRVAPPYHETHNGTSTPAPHSSDGNLSAVVYRVRIGEHPDKVRFVMELSGPVSAEISAENNSEILVDLPGAAWDALTSQKFKPGSLLESFISEALVDEKESIIGTRLRLRSEQAIAADGQGLLLPEKQFGHRLFVDFKKTPAPAKP